MGLDLSSARTRWLCGDLPCYESEGTEELVLSSAFRVMDRRVYLVVLM